MNRIKSITLEKIYWTPNEFYPKGGWAYNVNIVYRDGTRETIPTRMFGNENDAWLEALRMKSNLLADKK